MEITEKHLNQFLESKPILYGACDDLVFIDSQTRIWRSTDEEKQITVEKLGARGWKTALQFSPFESV